MYIVSLAWYSSWVLEFKNKCQRGFKRVQRILGISNFTLHNTI